MKRLNIFIVSDSVGETGEIVTNAVISQFRPHFEETIIRKFPYIESIDDLYGITLLAVKKMQ